MAPLVTAMTIGASQLRPWAAHFPAMGAAAFTAAAVGSTAAGVLVGAEAGEAGGARAPRVNPGACRGGLGGWSISTQPPPARSARTSTPTTAKITTRPD